MRAVPPGVLRRRGGRRFGGVVAVEGRVVARRGRFLPLLAAFESRALAVVGDGAVDDVRPDRDGLGEAVREPLRGASRGVDDEASAAPRRRLRDVQVEPHGAEAPVVAVAVGGLEVARPVRGDALVVEVGRGERVDALPGRGRRAAPGARVPHPAPEIGEARERGVRRGDGADERRVLNDGRQAVVRAVVLPLELPDDLVDVRGEVRELVLRPRVAHRGVKTAPRRAEVGTAEEKLHLGVTPDRRSSDPARSSDARHDRGGGGGRGG